MKMLCWMYGKTRKYKTRNGNNRECDGLAPIIENTVKNRLWWFGHVKRKPGGSVIKRLDQMEKTQIARGRGGPEKTIREFMRKDLEINNLDKSMVLDRVF